MFGDGFMQRQKCLVFVADTRVALNKSPWFDGAPAR
jgi:hypothetical protein